MNVEHRDELLRAIRADDAQEVSRLISRGVSLAPHPRHGSTPLRAACQLGALNAIKALVAGGADANERITYRSPVDKRVEQDFTPLFYASTPAVVDLLVQLGADVNAVSSTGLSALMRYAHFGRADLVEGLLRNGADAKLRQHKKRGRKARNALELAQASLAMWESFTEEQLKPGAEEVIAAHRKTVDLLLGAS